MSARPLNQPYTGEVFVMRSDNGLTGSVTEGIHATAGLAESAEGDSRFRGAVVSLLGFGH